MNESLVTFLGGKFPELLLRFWEHLYLTGIAVAAAAGAGVPLGIWICRHPLRQRWVLGTANVLQTVPSLAMLAFLLPFLGIGFWPAITALVLYALLPVLRGVVTGLEEVPADAREAGLALGMTPRQLLWQVEFPLALPSILTGLRLACVWSVGIATLSAFIGAGGLGDFINRGLALNNPRLLLLGALPAALLAVGLDTGVGFLQRRLQPWKIRSNNRHPAPIE
jgi:osmoprotectant transport system permease protein